MSDTANDDLLLSVATIHRGTSADNLAQPGNRSVNLDSNGADSTRTPEALRGWLLRHKKKGFLKTSDKKWYEFDDATCKLLIFSGLSSGSLTKSSERAPVDSIDISRSAFVIDSDYSEKPCVFSLSCDGQLVTLEAVSVEDMRRWIRELQTRREAYIKNQANSLDGRGHAGSFRSFSRSTSANETVLQPSKDERVGEGNDFEAIRAAAAIAGGDSNILVCFDDILRSDGVGSPGYADRSTFGLTLSPVIHAEPPQRSPSAKRRDRNPVNAFRSMFSQAADDKNHQKFEKALEDRMLMLKDELHIAKDELTAHKEIVRVLRKQLDFASREKEALKILVGSGDKNEGQLQLLRDRCRHILELEETLQTARTENEKLHQRNQILKAELTEMARRVASFQENVRAKDNAILLLNEQMTKMESMPREARSPAQKFVNESDEQMQRMKDVLEAYKEKLAFLNEEIVRQNSLRGETLQREEKLKAALSDWEAKYAKLESRHLFTMKDFAVQLSKDPVIPETDVDKIRHRILEEALGGSEEDSHEKALLECDRYGFFTSRLHYTSEEFLERKALEAERKQRIALMKKEPGFMDHLHRWENFLSKQTRLIQRSEELKNLMRIGCPDEHRGRVWKSCVEWRVSRVKTIKGPKYYQSLVHDNSSPLAFAAAKQIKIDLCRTLPNNIHFMNMDSDQIPALEEVLVAFSRHNPGVGYCQGMNRLVAIALLFLNEEDAFWCLTAIVDYLLPGYFSVNMVETQVDQRIFKDLFRDKLPVLYNHLSSFLDVTLYSFNWFLTVFVDNMHPDIFLPIWDAFLVEGRKVLFRFGLAMFKYFEDALMELKDPSTANRFLRTLGDKVTDLRKLQNIAYDMLNPFPMKQLRGRRAVHLPAILAEMQQLDQLRKSIPQTDRSADDEEE